MLEQINELIERFLVGLDWRFPAFREEKTMITLLLAFLLVATAAARALRMCFQATVLPNGTLARCCHFDVRGHRDVAPWSHGSRRLRRSRTFATSSHQELRPSRGADVCALDLERPDSWARVRAGGRRRPARSERGVDLICGGQAAEREAHAGAGASFAERPWPCSTCDGSVAPDWQADPPETASPFRSSAMTSASASTWSK